MQLAFKRVLVTGGAGFIGSHLTQALVAQRCRVTVLDNLSSGRFDNLTELHGKIDFHRGDIRNPEDIHAAVRDCEAVFHLAALVSVPLSVENPTDSATINDMGTLNVLNAARENRVQSVVFASSSAIYGDDPKLPKQEDMIPNPLSPYAVHKLTGEYYARLFTDLYGLPATSLRFFNVFGPRQDPSSPYSGVISIFMSKAVAGQQPTIYGDGEQRRDFVYVSDVVNAMMAAASRNSAAGRSVNIGTGTAITVNRLWKTVQEKAGIELSALYTSERPGDIRDSVADILQAENLLGYKPRVSFEDGMQRTYTWYRKATETG